MFIYIFILNISDDVQSISFRFTDELTEAFLPMAPPIEGFINLFKSCAVHFVSNIDLVLNCKLAKSITEKICIADKSVLSMV